LYTTRPSCSGAAESRERTDKNIGRWSWKRGEWKRVERGEMGFRHFFPWARENRTEPNRKGKTFHSHWPSCWRTSSLPDSLFFSVLVASAPLCLSVSVWVLVCVRVVFIFELPNCTSETFAMG
jgi:hypothetical protein